MKNILEISRTNKSEIVSGSNVTFDAASPYSEGIIYDPLTGEIILAEAGQYSVKWWIATETSMTGGIQFALRSSQGDTLVGCSPTKKGQVSGFGLIDATSSNVTLSLVNMGDYQVILSQKSPQTAALLVERIPQDAEMPTFDIDKVDTLAPDEDATVGVEEDIQDPNKWLFSFGIPKGSTGSPGTTPHIDTSTGNWFIGESDTNIKAQGPPGPIGPTAPHIYAQPPEIA